MSPFQRWAHGFNEVRLPVGGIGLGAEALAELLENVPLALAITTGPEHRYVFANRLFRALLVPRDADPVGKPLATIPGHLHTPEIEAFQGQVLRSGTPCELSGVEITGRPQRSFWDVKLLPVRNADDQVSGVMTVAANVTDRVTAQMEADRKEQDTVYSTERLALAVDATELGLWEWDARSGKTFWSDRQKEIFGLAKDQPETYEFWLSALHPDDRDRVTQAVSSLAEPSSGGQLSVEHRVVHPDGSVRWVLSRGRMLYESVDGTMKPARLLGTVFDVTDRHAAEESRQLLVRELNHRVKNLFAVASGMVSLTARSAATPKEMATTLRGRLDALSRAHELIRPAIADDEMRRSDTSVGELVGAILAPHVDQTRRERLIVDGGSVPVGPNAATALTLVLHEMATNASKYGALSVTDGRARITWTCEDGELVLVWDEDGGPVIEQAPAAEGFGSQLARKSVTGQLAGAISHEWRREGLRVTMRLPLDRLAV